MENTMTDILFAALLIIPTCAGLWFPDNEKPSGDDSILEQLQERRIARRRLGRPRNEDALVSHYLLKAGDDWQVVSTQTNEQPIDRRSRDRRAEDTRRGSHVISARTSHPVEVAAADRRRLPETGVDKSSSKSLPSSHDDGHA